MNELLQANGQGRQNLFGSVGVQAGTLLARHERWSRGTRSFRIRFWLWAEVRYHFVVVTFEFWTDE